MALILVTALSTGCPSSQLSEAEEEELTKIFRSGLEMGDDPFVRAETLRAIDLTGDPRLAEQALGLTDDPHPMVQIAALRVLVRADHPQARQRAMHLFNRGDEDLRYHILDVCLTDGNETLRRALQTRALRSNSSRLRLRALEDGLLQKIAQAQEAGDDEALRRELWPELGTYVDDDHPDVAATALRALLDAGQQERAEAVIERYQDDSLDTDERVAAARILMQARVEQARPAFEALLERAGAFDPEALGIPERRVDDDLLRLTVLGLAALGDPEFVAPAQRHLDEADLEQTLEVIDALAANPTSDAAVTLRTHMRDARADIRRRAIILYGQREDARPDALFGAIRHDDFEAQRSIVTILTERFPDQWRDYLAGRLESTDAERVESALRTMQQLLRTDEELAVIEPLQPLLERLATGEELPLEVDDDQATQAQISTIANLAAYMLFRISDEGTFFDVMANTPDRQTRYAYLEFLATNQPQDHIDTLRGYLYDDLFVFRLLAATGLWRAFADTVQWRGPAPEGGEEGDG